MRRRYAYHPHQFLPHRVPLITARYFRITASGLGSSHNQSHRLDLLPLDHRLHSGLPDSTIAICFFVLIDFFDRQVTPPGSRASGFVLILAFRASSVCFQSILASGHIPSPFWASFHALSVYTFYWHNPLTTSAVHRHRHRAHRHRHSGHSVRPGPSASGAAPPPLRRAGHATAGIGLNRQSHNHR